MLGRSLSILSGMCTGLNPDFNLWTLIAPYATKLVEAETKTGWKVILDEIGGNLRALISLPHKTENLFSKIEQGQLEVRNPDLQRQVVGLSHNINRLIAAIIFAAFLSQGFRYI